MNSFLYFLKSSFFLSPFLLVVFLPSPSSTFPFSPFSFCLYSCNFALSTFFLFSFYLPIPSSNLFLLCASRSPFLLIPFFPCPVTVTTDARLRHGESRLVILGDSQCWGTEWREASSSELAESLPSRRGQTPPVVAKQAPFRNT